MKSSPSAAAVSPSLQFVVTVNPPWVDHLQTMGPKLSIEHLTLASSIGLFRIKFCPVSLPKYCLLSLCYLVASDVLK